MAKISLKKKIALGVLVSLIMFLVFSFAANRWINGSVREVTCNFITTSNALQEKIGTVHAIGKAHIWSSSYKTSGNNGKAEINLLVVGEKGGGHVIAQLQKSDDTWNVIGAKYMPEDGGPEVSIFEEDAQRP